MELFMFGHSPVMASAPGTEVEPDIMNLVAIRAAFAQARLAVRTERPAIFNRHATLGTLPVNFCEVLFAWLIELPQDEPADQAEDQYAEKQHGPLYTPPWVVSP
jgi:hypothetical protein